MSKLVLLTIYQGISLTPVQKLRGKNLPLRLQGVVVTGLGHTMGEVLMQTIYINPIQMVLVIGMTRIGLVHALLCVAIDVFVCHKEGGKRKGVLQGKKITPLRKRSF